MNLPKMFESTRFDQPHPFGCNVGSPCDLVGRQLFVEMHTKHCALARLQSFDSLLDRDFDFPIEKQVFVRRRG